MIRRTLFGMLVTWLAVIAMALPGSAQEDDGLTGEIEIAALSRYIWHGQELSRHSIVLQPSLTLSYKGFSANVWGNWDSDPYFNGDHWNETDYTLSYDGEYGLLTFGAGYCYYDMDGSDDSQEVYLTLGLNTLLAPTLTVYREVGYDLYWYFLMSISHSFPLTEKISLDLSASVSYLSSDNAGKYPEVDGDGNETGREFDNFHDGTLTLRLPYTVSDRITVTPTLSYTFPLCTEARREMDYFSMTGQDHHFLYGGVSFAYSF